MKGTLDGIVEEVHGPLGNCGTNSINKFQSHLQEVHTIAGAQQVIDIISPSNYNRPRRFCTTINPIVPGMGLRLNRIRVKQRKPAAKHGKKRCPCEAFKLLDTWYTRHPQNRGIWRRAARGSRMSAYDYFMKLNLKRMNLGIDGISLPPKGPPKVDYFLGLGDIPAPAICKFIPLDTVLWESVRIEPDYNAALVFLDFYDPRTRNTTPGRIQIMVKGVDHPDYETIYPWGDLWHGFAEEFILDFPPTYLRIYWGPLDVTVYQRTLKPFKEYFGPMHGKTRR